MPALDLASSSPLTPTDRSLTRCRFEVPEVVNKLIGSRHFEPRTMLGRLSRSNGPPTNSDSRKIGLLLSKCDEAGDSLDSQEELIEAEIERLQELLEQVEENRDRVDAIRRKATSLQSCVRILPAEILERIFIETLEEGSWSRNNAGLLLCRVCRRWREVARACPFLWTELRLSMDHKTKNIEGLITHFFSTSSGLPLTLRLERPLGRTHQSETIIKALQPWRTIKNVEIYTLVIMEIERSLKRLGNVNLDVEQLCIRLAGPEGDAVVQPPAMPNLRKAILTLVNRGSNLQYLPLLRFYDKFPWAQLTHFSTRSAKISPEDLLDVFSRCTMLQHASFILHGHPLWRDCQPMVLPNMHSLKLILMEGGSTNILSHLSMPALQRLTFGTRAKGWTRWDAEALKSFHLPSLESITFFGIQISLEDFIAFVHPSKKITSLTVENTFHPSAFADKLFLPYPYPSDNSTILLPCLTHLEIYQRIERVDGVPPHWSTKILAQMIMTRRSPRKNVPGILPLKSLTFIPTEKSVHPSFSKEVFDLASRLRRGGFAMWVEWAYRDDGYFLDTNEDW